MINHLEIVRYWINTDFVTAEDEPACFACGEEVSSWCRLERAHLVAKSIGGEDKQPGNYILLCRTCHREAPMTSDSVLMLQWARDHESRLSRLVRLIHEAMKQAGITEDDMVPFDPKEFMEHCKHRKMDWHPAGGDYGLINSVTVLLKDYLQVQKDILAMRA